MVPLNQKYHVNGHDVYVILDGNTAVLMVSDFPVAPNGAFMGYSAKRRGETWSAYPMGTFRSNKGLDSSTLESWLNAQGTDLCNGTF